jgi:hypothetical protein
MNSLLSGCIAVIIIGQMALSAQPLASSQAPIALWPDGAPGALGTGSNDIPTITAYFPPPELALLVLFSNTGSVHTGTGTPECWKMPPARCGGSVSTPPNGTLTPVAWASWDRPQEDTWRPLY